MGRRRSDTGLLGHQPTTLRLTEEALTGAPAKPHAVAVVVIITGIAFVIGGALRDLMLAAIREDAGLVAAALPLLLPIILQAAVGYAALAVLLRGRYPASSIWIIGVMSTTALVIPALLVNGIWIYPLMASIAVSWPVGLAIGLLLRIRGAAWKVLTAYFVGSMVAQAGFWAFGAASLGTIVMAGELGDIGASYQMAQLTLLEGTDLPFVRTMLAYAVASGHVLAAASTTAGVVVQDLLAGVTAAIGINWALGKARLKDGTIIRYLPAKNFTTEIQRTAASDGLDY